MKVSNSRWRTASTLPKFPLAAFSRRILPPDCAFAASGLSVSPSRLPRSASTPQNCRENRHGLPPSTFAACRSSSESSPTSPFQAIPTSFFPRLRPRTLVESTVRGSACSSAIPIPRPRRRQPMSRHRSSASAIPLPALERPARACNSSLSRRILRRHLLPRRLRLAPQRLQLSRRMCRPQRPSLSVPLELSSRRRRSLAAASFKAMPFTSPWPVPQLCPHRILLPDNLRPIALAAGYFRKLDSVHAQPFEAPRRFLPLLFRHIVARTRLG